MTQKRRSFLQAQAYGNKNPRKAKIIKLAVKRGVREYAETFRRLAAI